MQRPGRWLVGSETGSMRKARLMSESDLAYNVLDCATKLGISHKWHSRPARVLVDGKETYRTAGTGDVGFPDWALAHEGRVLLVELKRQNAIVPPEQVAWGVALGEIYRLWRPADWLSGLIIEELRRLAGRP
jgi:hypothetical protein